MRIHDDVGANSLVCERHILLVHDQASHSLLAVPTAEFVTDFWHSRLPHQEFDEKRVVVIARNHNFLDKGANCVAIADKQKYKNQFKSAFYLSSIVC